MNQEQPTSFQPKSPFRKREIILAIGIVISLIVVAIVFLGGNSGTKKNSATSGIQKVLNVEPQKTPEEEMKLFFEARAKALAEKGDSDGDDLLDTEEKQLGTDPNNPDTDGDHLTDGQEVKILKTNPLKVDSDGDGVSDWDQGDKPSTKTTSTKK